MTRYPATRAAGVLAFFLALGLVACGGLEKLRIAERNANLNDKLRAYAKLIRWNEFEAARRFIRLQPGASKNVVAQTESLLSSVKVTRYRLKKVIFDEQQKRASVTHTLRFYHQDNRREVSTTDSQMWWWDDSSARWYLTGDMPDFAKALSP